MSHKRRILYSVSLAITITALSWLFFAQGGSSFLVPGFFSEVLLGFVVIIDPEEVLLTERAWGGNVVIYSVSFYVISWFSSAVKAEIQKTHSTGAKSGDGTRPTAKQQTSQRELGWSRR